MFTAWMALVASCGSVPAETTVVTSTDAKEDLVLEHSDREPNPAIDHFRLAWPGLSGYRVIHEGADARSWISLEHGGLRIDLGRDTLRRVPGPFPNKADDLLLWRGLNLLETFQPYALVYRMSSSPLEPGQAGRDSFVVIRLEGQHSGVAAVVPAQQGQQAVLELADELFRP